MPFDGITIHALQKEIQSIIVGSRIDKIHQPENDEIVLHIRSDRKNHKLLLSADSNLPHFGLTELKKENPQNAPMFCMLLRKHLSGGRIIDFQQLELERVIILTVESRDELGDITKKRLIFEIMGKHSNITLVDEDDKILDCIKRIALGVNRYRQLFPGITYLFPPNDKIDPRTLSQEAFIKNMILDKPLFKHLYMTYQGMSPIVARELCIQSDIDFNSQELLDMEKAKLANNLVRFFQDLDDHLSPQVIYQSNQAIKDLSIIRLTPYQGPDFVIKHFETVIDTVNAYYANKNTVNKLLQRSHSLRKSIQGKVDRLRKKLQNLHEDLMYAESADDFKIKGELILANIYRIDKGAHKVTLENYYDNNQLIEIRMDTRLSPSDNAQVFFKKYNKLKTAQVKVQEQIEHTREEIAYLEQVLLNAEQSDDQQNIEEIQEELILSGYLRRKQKHGKKKPLKSQPLKYKTSDGFEVLVGKNNLQNDHISLKLASKSDWWFHTKDIPGSHVIVRCYGKDISETAVKEAAIIAAYHSKGRESSQVPVDYTEVRNLKKPNGAKPGMVIFHTNQTIYVTPTRDIEQQKD